jgi:hypothetical protein
MQDAAAGAPDAGAAAECREDLDCTLTRIDEAGCCESLCHPRAVLRGQLAALEESARACTAQGRCPEVNCSPPLLPVSAACSAGRCAVSSQPPSPSK